MISLASRTSLRPLQLAAAGASRRTRLARPVRTAAAAKPESEEGEAPLATQQRSAPLTASRGGGKVYRPADPTDIFLAGEQMLDSFAREFFSPTSPFASMLSDWPSPRLQPTRFPLPASLAHEQQDLLRPRRISCDLEENESEYVLKADLPGIKMEDIRVSIHPSGEYVTIEVSKKEEKVEDKVEEGEEDKTEEATVTVHRTERAQHYVRRQIPLASHVDPDKCEATIGDGVLTVVMTKSDEGRAKPLEIKPISN